MLVLHSTKYDPPIRPSSRSTPSRRVYGGKIRWLTELTILPAPKF